MADSVVPGLSGVNVNSMVTGAASMWNQLQILFPYILIGVLIGVGIFYIMRLKQHRIKVEIMEVVKNGYITYSNRYAIAWDKETNLEYLRPIFGKDRLPPFPLEYFHKIKSAMPLGLGVNREITLIKYNKYTYKIVMPPSNNNNAAEIYYSDIKRWTYMEEHRKFLAKLKQKDSIQWLSVAAPLAIIVGCFVFFAVLIFIQIQQENALAARIDLMSKVILAKLGG